MSGLKTKLTCFMNVMGEYMYDYLQNQDKKNAIILMDCVT